MPKLSSIDDYPIQGQVNRLVDVIFNFDESIRYKGRIVRDDLSPPYLTIIELIGGKIIMGNECQFTWSK